MPLKRFQNELYPSQWPSGIGEPLGEEQVVSSIPGSVGYISYPMFIDPTITWVPSGFPGYIWLDTKVVLTRLHTRRVDVTPL